MVICGLPFLYIYCLTYPLFLVSLDSQIFFLISDGTLYYHLYVSFWVILGYLVSGSLFRL
jgi:hypothetical protein